METHKAVTKAEMQPAIDFISKALDLIKDEEYKKSLRKIIDNVAVAQKAMADNEEKAAYLYALYVNNASELGCYLFRNNLLTPAITEEFYTLPTREDASAVLKYYLDADEAERKAITERQIEFANHHKGLEVFKGIALGDTPEEAKAGVAEHEQKIAEAMAQR